MRAIRLGTVENRCNNCQAQFFTRLLAPFLAGRPRFRLSCVGSVGLAVGLAIGGAVSTAGEAAVGLSG